MWLLVDMSYLTHRARHALKDLESEDMPTGVLYGFFEQLMSICSHPNFCSNKVLIFADSKKSHRAKTFPAYKKKRAENRTEEEWEQINVMRKQAKILRKEVLPAIGFPVYGQVGLESDDLIAWAASELTDRKEYGVIITSDGDLYQCITPYINWYDPQREILHNVKTLRQKKKCRPDQWGLVKAIGGCATDCVPGIAGIGEKGAIDYLNDKLPIHYKKYKLVKAAIKNKELQKWEDLVILPHHKTKPIRIREPEYNPDAFFEFCKKYDIDSYLEGSDKQRWEWFFEGKFKGKTRRRERKTRRGLL